MKPTDSALYQPMLSGNFPSPIRDRLAPPPLHSAYLAAQKHEPAYTCHSQIVGVPHFSDCLDYIFYSTEGWEISEVLPIPAIPSAASYPSLEEPSDHVMIAATFTLLALPSSSSSSSIRERIRERRKSKIFLKQQQEVENKLITH